MVSTTNNKINRIVATRSRAPFGLYNFPILSFVTTMLGKKNVHKIITGN